MTVLVGLLFTAAAFAQSATVSGTSGTVSGSISLPLAPSVLTITCSPMSLQKGVPSNCTIALDVPVPQGQSFPISLTVAAPAGVTVVATPLSVTIQAGSSTCGNATTPCFTVTRP